MIKLTLVDAQARVAKFIAPEEEWLRLLVLELRPVMLHLQKDDLPPSELP